MLSVRQIARVGALAAILFAVSGCSMFHDLNWWRLHRLNRMTKPSFGPEFSISDPLDEEAAPNLLLSSEPASPMPSVTSAER